MRLERKNYRAGYIASVPGIPNPQGQMSINGIYRVGVALPLGLRASNDSVGLYVEPSLSATIFERVR